MAKKNRGAPRKPKEVHEPTPEEIAEKTRREQADRMTQLLAIRKQITERIGNIYHEIPAFELDGSAWVRDGKAREGSKVLSVVPKRFVWKFHEDIRKYPEVFLIATSVSG